MANFLGNCAGSNLISLGFEVKAVSCITHINICFF